MHAAGSLHCMDRPMQCRQCGPAHGNVPRPPAGSSLVTVYAENWTAEKQTVTMATTFSKWVAGNDTHDS